MEKDPDYIRRLESLPYELREAWLNGNWDVMAGQYFSEWDRAVHVCDPFMIPDHWRRYVTMDYGTDMLAAYVIAVDEEGGCWVIREAYEGKDLGEGHEGGFSAALTQPAGTVCASVTRQAGAVVAASIGGAVTLGEPFEVTI